MNKEELASILNGREMGNEMTMNYLGIDNGISGGLALLSDRAGLLIDRAAMPIQKSRKGNEIDIVSVWKWIAKMDLDPDKITVAIEEPGGSKSAKAACSMAGSFHALRAMCDLKGLRWHRITPQAWQKKMLPGCQSGDTKPRALALARQIWPDEEWLVSKRCEKPHDGMIDAALIAEHSRILNL